MLTARFIDREETPTPPLFGYGKYRIKINSDSVFFDFRDADYYDSYDADVWLHYTSGTGFYEPASGNRYDISNNSTVGIWEHGRKSSGTPSQESFSVSFTIQNSFSGGQVTIDNTNHSSPYSASWDLESPTHTIAAISPQTVDGLVLQYSSWSDGKNQSHALSVSSDKGTYTANFNVVKPVQVSGVSVGGSVGDPITVTWDQHPNSGVTYQVWRKVRHNGVTGAAVQLTTLAHNVTTFEDPDFLLANNSSYLVYYDIRAYHGSSGTSADAQWSGPTYGQLYRRSEGDKSTIEAGRKSSVSYGLSTQGLRVEGGIHIQYSLPAPSCVNVGIYDVLGREVALLVNGFRQGGSYSLKWVGARLSTGMYFVRMMVSDDSGALKYFTVKKITLIR